MKKYLKYIWFLFFRRSPLAVVGRIFFPIMPERVYKVQSDFFVGKSNQFIDKCLKAEINHRYYEQSDLTLQEENRKHFWGASHAKRWHECNESLAAENFEERMKYKIPLIDWTTKHVENHKITTICEVGTGMGHFLLILRKNVIEKKSCKFVGFDLNDDCIQEAKRRCCFPDTEFYCGDAKKYIAEKADKNTLFIFCGTLEYFTQTELENTLDLIAEKKPSMIAISEPIELDRKNESVSKQRANISFSHNYEYLFEKHGYSILEKKIEQINPKISFYEVVMLLAEKT